VCASVIIRPPPLSTSESELPTNYRLRLEPGGAAEWLEASWAGWAGGEPPPAWFTPEWQRAVSVALSAVRAILF
jgi:hypothetical protein